MNIAEYIAVVWRHKVMVVLTVVVTTTVTLLGTLLMSPTYRATAKLHVSTTTNGSTDWVDLDLRYADRLMNTYAQLAASDPVRTELGTVLGVVDRLPEIEVSVIPNTELMRITVEGEDPELVANTANELSSILIRLGGNLSGQAGQKMRDVLEEEILLVEQELENARADFARQWNALGTGADDISSARGIIDLKERSYESLLNLYEQTRVRDVILANSLTVVDPADVPRSPSSPNIVVNVALAMVVGLIGGVGFAFLFENLQLGQRRRRTRIATTQPEPSSMTGMQPNHMARASDGADNGEPGTRSQLHAALLKAIENKTQHTVLVTSTGEEADSPTPLVDAAIGLAGDGHRVVIVECFAVYSASRNAEHHVGGPGFGDVLTGSSTLDEVIHTTTTPGLGVIPPGVLVPAQFLDSTMVADALRKLQQRFELVVLHGPAFFRAETAASLAPAVDGVIVMVGTQQNSTQIAGLIMKQLAGIGANLIATVLLRHNGAAPPVWNTGSDAMFKNL